MTDKIQKNQIADILLDFYDEYDSNVINRPMIPNIYAGKILDSLQEEPVSEDLEEACEQLAENARKHKAETSSPFFSQTDYKQGVIDGAQWQKEQIEKERFIKRELGFIKGYREKAIKELEKVENQESVKEDLEEEIEHYFTLWYDNEGGGCLKPDRWLNNLEDCKGIARHFANWQKQQMMKDAVEGIVHNFGSDDIASIHYNDPKGIPMSYFVSSKGLNAGDKVKLITIKED